MNARSLLVALAAALAGCALVAPARPLPDHGPFGKTDGRLDAERWLTPDARRARAAGARDSAVVAVDSGAPGDKISGLVSVPDDECVLLLARASDDIDDVDLFAYGDDGSLLGSDERPDKSPTILVCPPHPRRLYVTARVAAGHGLVAVGAHRVAIADAARVGKALAARGFGSGAAGSVESFPDLDEKVTAHRQAVGGAWREIRRVATPLDAGMPSVLSAVVDADHCVDVLVVPSEDVSHLDVAAVDSSGRIAGRAIGRGRERFFVACSPDKASFGVEIRPQSGRGFAAVVISESRDPSERSLTADVPVVELAPLKSLADERAAVAGALEAQAYGPGKQVAEGNLGVGRRDSHDVELAEGCTRLDVVAAKPLRGVEAWLWDAKGDLVAHDRGNGNAVLFACGPRVSARLDLEALARGGPFVVEQRPFKDSPRAFVENPLAAGRLLTRMLARGVVRRADQVGSPATVSVGATHQSDAELLVPVGRCVDVTLALGPGASGAEVRLVDVEGGAEIERDQGTNSAAARACALKGSATLKVRAELRAVSGETRALYATRMLAPRE